MTELQELMKTEVHIPMCGCGKPMSFQETEKTWRCLACNPIPLNAPICATQKCKRPLTWLEETGCWRCLHCNPIVEPKPAEEKERTYIDVTLTEKRVGEMIKKEMAGIGDIVRETMAEFNLKEPDDPDYSEIADATSVGGTNFVANIDMDSVNAKPETWLQKAKRLGVKTHIPTGGMRKKVDIMADMEKAENETV